MAKRTKKDGTLIGRNSTILNLLLGRLPARKASPDPSGFMEVLEARLLMSHAHVLPAAPTATPDYVIYRPAGDAQPAASASPVGLAPSVVRQAYGINSVQFGSVVGDGNGQTIAIVDAYNDPTIVADLHAFDVAYGLADPASFKVVGQTGTTALPGTDPAGAGNSWAIEIALDVEWAHVVGPGANIVLIEANSSSTSDLFTAANTARNLAGVSVVSMSWGAGESSSMSTYNSYFTTPSGHNGVTFVASSGDSGAYVSSRTMGVSYPAASPNVLSVGGTRLTVDASGNYVSESGWGNGTSSYSSGGSGGGISRYTVQPAYQKGVVTQSTTYRAVPDVAFLADPASGVAVYDSWDFGSASPWVTVGGTSLASPMWAGVIAIADQGRVLSGQGTLDGATQTLPMIYALPSTDFRDITTGNNGYAAAAGFDLVTGRGTPIVNKLALDLVGGAVQPAPTAPTAPSGLAATVASSSQITISWKDNSNNETGFHVYRLSGTAWVLVGTTGANVSSFTDSGLTASTLYTYQVSAYNSVADVMAATSASATTQAATVTAPAAPANVAAAAASATQVKVSWTDNSTNETGFHIYRWNGSAWQVIGTVAAGTTTFSDTSVVASTTYYYQVTAYNSAGETWAPSYATVTTPAATSSGLPAAPSNLAWTRTSSTQFVLTWADNSTNETGFRLEYWTGTAWAVFGTVGAGVTSVTVNAPAGNTYFIRVAAYNSLGETPSAIYVTVI